MSPEDIALFTLFTLLAGVAAWTQKLTPAGGIAGALVAICIYLGAGMCGVAMLGIFFLAGSLATKYGLAKKEAMGYAEHDKVRRKASQVLANGGLAAAFAIAGHTFPSCRDLALVLVAACFSSAIADTLSSELGTLYGRRFYNVMTWKPDKRGENGVVSLEGTLIGIGGSLLIALIYLAGHWSLTAALVVLIAGTAGNFADSMLGATVERRGVIGNDLVNFLNTLTAALVALALTLVTQ